MPKHRECKTQAKVTRRLRDRLFVVFAIESAVRSGRA
jgi:hypothetical protein